jgi:hypothetical protein
MEQEITFKVTAKEADIILGALTELPFKMSADLFFKMRQVFNAARFPAEPQVEGEK